MNKQLTIDKDQFLDKLEAYPKEVIDIFLTSVIVPERRENTLSILNGIKKAWETEGLMEEYTDVLNTINHLENKRGDKPLEKIKQLRKKADGLAAAMGDVAYSGTPEDIQIDRGQEYKPNKNEDAGNAPTEPTSSSNDTDA